ncbi:MAG: hypothetical protein PUP93_33395, partial [Rhizonema sp. NSF051]|nr:hypothetical protein [Rhizonema sp. NSF051]
LYKNKKKEDKYKYFLHTVMCQHSALSYYNTSQSGFFIPGFTLPRKGNLFKKEVRRELSLGR